ncbi:hypothetical protein AKJ64_01615 [candidate division MSBL1 archaeon SCGC-AAA259E17]|uniref:Uncharacterized protein n=1 Tax=candidate division MSBL1 archaeon SCGC-AAA259E17 TaxID=1698263 RepID=A0A133UFP4_9EURY|nr:hypothetical protein AKJ64_01615 [candidate division MSBL1 archaeon SCGC-AAA259E17]
MENAGIALLNEATEVKETEADSEIPLSDPEQLQQFLDHEEEELQEMVDKVKEAGVNAVFCPGGYDDIAGRSSPYVECRTNRWSVGRGENSAIKTGLSYSWLLSSNLLRPYRLTWKRFYRRAFWRNFVIFNQCLNWDLHSFLGCPTFSGICVSR